jgi:hemerythrin-like domain-containing protein
MKRDQNFQDLSRDHHHALVLARSAERAASSDRDEEIAMAWELIESKYEKELAPHFEVEESHILRYLEALGFMEIAQRTRDEHGELLSLVVREGEARERLLQFGGLLRAHVRFEENELFPLAEKVLTPAQLSARRHRERASARVSAASKEVWLSNPRCP